ncbi:hypothetical protein LHYA1_G006513 [Lachnellula hyalina]|uniref:Clr5 domain-containing protein n=1 Tax=Lachnellula hyalina TaxID=1316788 RepID=A0A8H8QYJ3_9HELO|nr:uncharacterized protein LHYA1_G006513 [Lachnellula hyalina]TVY25232.1 hypothetical protein LHYA1_G006513 [Lachnellula hyalina]
MPRMDTQHSELSIEDVLSIHRHWITKLYIEDHMNEQEIVDLLYERRLTVTPSQIQRCLREWNSTTTTSPSFCSSRSTSSLPSTTDSDDWHALRCPSSPSSISTSVEEPHFAELYKKRPLPSLPSSRPLIPPKVCKERKRQSTGYTRDSLETQCHDGSLREPTKVGMKPGRGVIPKGPSPLQIYALDQQSHERLAVGLGRVSSLRGIDIGAQRGERKGNESGG